MKNRSQNIEKQSSRARRIKQKRLLLVLNCAICNKKKPRFITNQEANELLNKLVIITLLSKIPLISEV